MGKEDAMIKLKDQRSTKVIKIGNGNDQFSPIILKDQGRKRSGRIKISRGIALKPVSKKGFRVKQGQL